MGVCCNIKFLAMELHAHTVDWESTRAYGRMDL